MTDDGSECAVLPCDAGLSLDDDDDDDEFCPKPTDGFFGFLFLVCMPSFFIVNGLLT